MSKAFTFLCKKVNLSLYKDTLTVYPKSDNQLNPRSEFELLLLIMFAQMDCQSMQVNQFFLQCSKELGVYRFVHREDTDHDQYHQDSFDPEQSHYHAEFKEVIGKAKLIDILSILEKHKLISSDEQSGFLKAYDEANTLPSKSTSSLSTTTTTTTTTTSLTKTSSVTFANFKPGFLLNLSSSQSETHGQDDSSPSSARGML